MAFSPRTEHTDPIAVVADDDEGVRSVVGAWLEGRGFRVRTVRDGVELVEHLGELQRTGRLSSPVMVVADIDMPRRNGLAALEIIHRRFPNVRVVLLTAFADALTRARALALGAAAVLPKPCSWEQLAAFLEKYRGHRRALHGGRLD